MTPVAQNKRKVSVTIDEDLIEELEGSDESLSAQVNEAIRGVVEQRRRRAQLRAWLDDVATTEGPVDEADVARFLDLLS